MSVHFSGWETTNEGAPPAGGELESSQTPTDRGLYTMYHGTSVSSARLIISDGFQQSQKGMLGKGVYVSRDRKKANGYPKNSGHTERVVLQVQVRVGRVKSIDRDHHPLQYTWHDHGYDTAWVPPRCGFSAVRSGLEEDCVFDPDRVRVVAVVKAPDDTVTTELQELLGRASGGPGVGPPDYCSLCRRRTRQGSEHVVQRCWSCGRDICIFMHKHVCQAQGRQLPIMHLTSVGYSGV